MSTSRSLVTRVSTIICTTAWVIGGASLHAEGTTPILERWDLVRSVSNPYGGTQDLVLIPELKQRDREYYLAVANVVCGERTACSVNFWTDRAHIPTSANMPVADLAVMTASYARSPRYTAPVLSLACWLYPNREIAEMNNCAYSSGAVVPWKSPTEDEIRKFQ
jgi:hypothetical protein